MSVLRSVSRKLPHSITDFHPAERRDAIRDFYNVNAPDPTNSAFSNLDVNFGGSSVLTCVGGCRLNGSSSDIVYNYTTNQVTEFSFAQLASNIDQSEVLDAYNRHIAYISSYGPNYLSVIQPVLRAEYDRVTGVVIGYLWTSRVYQQGPDNQPRFLN
jgi:hypothetical protein